MLTGEKRTGGMMEQRITTVLGDIAPEDLGLTSAHEHVMADMIIDKAAQAYFPPERLKAVPENMAFLRDGVSVFSDDCRIWNDVEFAAEELSVFRTQVNGGAVCDASPPGMRGDVRLLREASRRSGVHLLCCTGLYLLHRHPEELRESSQAELEDLFAEEIENGISGTDVKPGFVKCALGTLNEDGTEVHPRELTALRACAATAARYGLSLQVHTAEPMTHGMVMDAVHVILHECGLTPDKLIMLHMDAFLRPSADLMRYVSGELESREVSVKLPAEILATGANISFDAWGTPFKSVLPDDYERARGLIQLLRMGFEDHIVLGHDVITKAAGSGMGYYGFTRFADFVPSMLEPCGFAREVSRKLMKDNPARILAHTVSARGE